MNEWVNDGIYLYEKVHSIELLERSLKVLKEAKALIAPNTTNNTADELIKDLEKYLKK